MQSNTSEKQNWEREYIELKAIPSTTRTLPSKPLLIFSEIIQYSNFRRVLDAGCGNGRNAVYLAQRGCVVDAVDSSDAALNQCRALAENCGLQERINIQNCSLTDKLPFLDGYFDLAIDSYVFCHFVSDDKRAAYMMEMSRVLKKGGVMFSSTFSTEDEYYEQFIHSTPDGATLTTDPANGITKRLYSEAELKRWFAKFFSLAYFTKFEFQDLVLGRSYIRSVFACILEN